MRKIAIIGSTGSGKTTLGRHLAATLGAVSIDLDELNWESGWEQVSQQVFEARLDEALQASKWVTSGNYSRIQEKYLQPADTLIWLDYSFRITLGRLLIRTARRIVLREKCCNGNVETWRLAFSRDSVVLWLFQTYKRRRKQNESLFRADSYPHLTKLRFRSPRETQRWLDSL